MGLWIEPAETRLMKKPGSFAAMSVEAGVAARVEAVAVAGKPTISFGECICTQSHVISCCSFVLDN